MMTLKAEGELQRGTSRAYSGSKKGEDNNVKRFIAII